jgi:hypothetical protein
MYLKVVQVFFGKSSRILRLLFVYRRMGDAFCRRLRQRNNCHDFFVQAGAVKIEAFDEVFEERRMIFYA